MEENQEVSVDSSIKVANGCIEVEGEWVSPEIQAAMAGDPIVMVDTDATQ